MLQSDTMDKHSLDLSLVKARSGQNMLKEKLLRLMIAQAADDINHNKALVFAELVGGVAFSAKNVVNKMFIVGRVQLRHDCSEIFHAFGAVQIV